MADENLVIGGSSVTASQMQEFFRQMKGGSITRGMVQNFLERKNPFEEISSNPSVSQNVLRDWERFYKKHFALTVDLSGILIPKKPTVGEWRLIFIVLGLFNNKVYDACKRKFLCYKSTDNLDAGVPKNDRDPKNGTYAIWARDTVEADEVHKNKSAMYLAQKNIKGITLLERMILELKYFTETGKHLDVDSWTLCSGSRSSDGNVPDACCIDGAFKVGWSNVESIGNILRSREVVS